MADQDVINARRAEWRADLHEYAAAGKEGFGDTAGAAASRLEAENLRTEADLSLRFAAAKEADKNGPEAEMLAIQLREHRKQWREARSDPARGVPALSIINNFEEPSDDDHLAGGKAK